MLLSSSSSYSEETANGGSLIDKTSTKNDWVTSNSPSFAVIDTENGSEDLSSNGIIDKICSETVISTISLLVAVTL